MEVSFEEKLVVAVVAYSAQFSHALTQEEIFHRLFYPHFLHVLEGKGSKKTSVISTPFLTAKTHKTLSLKELSVVLARLVQKKLLLQKGRYFTLFLTPQSLAITRPSPQVVAYKEQLIEEMVTLAQKVPWVLGVVLTGSYAAGARADKDDIDFLMITQKNRLWLTRLLFLLVTTLKGRRMRFPGGDISHSWDLNFWLDETRISLPKGKQSLYEAYEVLQTRWVVQKNSIYERFMKENKWVYQYFSENSFPKVSQSKNSSQGKLGKEYPFLLFRQLTSFIGDLFEKGAFFLQVFYREKRHGKQRADAHSAFFHPESTRGKILENWQKLYTKTLA